MNSGNEPFYFNKKDFSKDVFFHFYCYYKSIILSFLKTVYLKLKLTMSMQPLD